MNERNNRNYKLGEYSQFRSFTFNNNMTRMTKYYLVYGDVIDNVEPIETRDKLPENS